VPELSNDDPRAVGLKAPSAAFRLGFLAAAWQIFLLREFTAQFYGSEISLGFILAFWLLWGGLGSRIAGQGRLGRFQAETCLLASLFGAPLGFALLRLAGPVLGLLPGEVTGFGPILIFAAAASLPVNFFLGAAFARTAAESGPSSAYLRESAGAVTGAALSYGLLIPFLPAGAALTSISVLAVFLAQPWHRGKKRAWAWIAVAAWSLLPAILDSPGQALRWRPFELVLTRDGPYGRLQVIRSADEWTIYENGLKSYSPADRSGAEEAVAFAFLQRPRTGRVLLLGGGLAGPAAEALRYGPASVEIVEGDASYVKAVRPYLSEADREALSDPRVRLTIADGRGFLGSPGPDYDVILIGWPDPATAQLNRYFSAELFRLAAARLSPEGVLSFRAGAAENYIGPALAGYLAAHRATLASAFARVEIIPGASAVFLASGGDLTVDPVHLAEEMGRRGTATPSLNSESLRARLHPLRIDRLRAALDAADPIINSDDRPISYYFHARLWSVQKRGADAAMIGGLARVSPRLLLAAALLPLLLSMLLSVGKARRGRRTPPAYPYLTLGATAMAAEILLFIRFQTLHGGLYGRMALLLGLFMAGTAAGAWRGRRGPGRLGAAVLLPPAFAALLLGLSALGWDKFLGPIGFACLFPVWGYWSGFFFNALVRACPAPPEEAGRGYAADLLGSFAGALVLAAVLVPLAGLDRLFAALAILHLALLAALAADPRYRRS